MEDQLRMQNGPESAPKINELLVSSNIALQSIQMNQHWEIFLSK